MKTRLTTLCLLAVGLALLAAPAFGQIQKDGEINVFFGYSTHSFNEFQIGPPQATPAIKAKFDVLDGMRGGVRLNVVNNGHWGQEFFYSFERNKGVYTRPSGDLELDLQVHNFGATGLFYFSKDEAKRTRPFLSFGLGATVYKPTDDARGIANDVTRGNLPGFGQANEISFHYGAGLKQRINKAMGVRVDARHFIGRFPSFSLTRHTTNITEPVFPADGAIHNLELTGGLLFYFGR
jgi:hypothetical protein